MRVAIVHYHLGQGGVARVIERSSEILSRAGISHVILTGDAVASCRSSYPIREIAGLGYQNGEGGGGDALEAMVSRLRCEASAALGGPPDLWHFHNHSLGKNARVGELVARLADDGECLLLQLHDLAEDGRAANYQRILDRNRLYPIAPRIHYAFLNSQDRARFIAAGLPAECASVLPNPVLPELPENDLLGEERDAIWFAPVRGIRRKNLGELLLLAALSPEGVRVATSRAPSNPAAVPQHARWQELARQHRLPVEFAVVDRLAPVAGAASNFEAWLKHSTHFITTSVAEGFGLPFLEAIAHGKPLIGRNLAHLAADFAANGIVHGELYDRLLVPLEWVGEERLRAHLSFNLKRDFQNFGRAVIPGMIESAMATIVLDQSCDFGNLPEQVQQEILQTCTSPACRQRVMVQQGPRFQGAVAWLARVNQQRAASHSAGQLAAYSADRFRGILIERYRELTEQAAGPARYLPAEEVLNAYSKPEMFHFLVTTPQRHRAVIFDIYGTLLTGPAGGVKPDPVADPKLREVLLSHGYQAPESPSAALHALVRRAHAAACEPYPEVDLQVLWRELLKLEAGVDTRQLVRDCEAVWHPTTAMPGAAEIVQELAGCGIPLGLLSNAQCNTLDALGDIASCFASDLSLLSYQEGIAKPSPQLFEKLGARLRVYGIAPGETLFVGNDPMQDIVPAAAQGFRTALFTGHPASHRPGNCLPDAKFACWTQLRQII
jgi:FMN phosphatase YigB (HAD superfamily)/glycosyltransferase involved in cell wall biosynthesis